MSAFNNITDISIVYFSEKIKDYVNEIMNNNFESFLDEYSLNEMILKVNPFNNYERQVSIVKQLNPFYFYFDENIFNSYFELFRNKNYLSFEEEYNLKLTIANKICQNERNKDIKMYIHQTIKNEKLDGVDADKAFNDYTAIIIVPHTLNNSDKRRIKDFLIKMSNMW
jgi:hypothetical protein